MKANYKDLMIGGGLLLGFAVVLVLMFMPLFQDKNLLNKIDDLYNSISKGSAYYIPKLQRDAKLFDGQMVTVSLKIDDEKKREAIARILEFKGISSQTEQAQLNFTADFGQLMRICLEDADLMFANQGSEIRSRYGAEERSVLFHWWTGLRALEKSLTKQKQFSEAKFVMAVNQKAVEAAYNYYGIEAQKIGDRVGLVSFSLVFYVIYTLWFGMGIMYLFKGAGLKLEH